MTGRKKRQSIVDRRSFLKTALIGSAALNTTESDTPKYTSLPATTSQATASSYELEKIIDMHIHLVRGNPDLKSIGDYGSRMTDVSDDVKAGYLKREMEEGGIGLCFGMGHRNGTKEDPLGIASTLNIVRRTTGLKVIGVIDPAKTGREHYLAVERQLERERQHLVAFKAYLGYQHYGPDAPGYLPYYKLAAKYRLPVVLHTGDTWSLKSKVKYAHPLLVDEVAVDHPSVNFVIAHFGQPWFLDAAEVVGKNDNVWTDLSGLVVDEKGVEEIIKTGKLPDAPTWLGLAKQAITLLDRYDRLLYGSDWPFIPMISYRRLTEVMIPKAHHKKVFRTNAEDLFKVKL